VVLHPAELYGWQDWQLRPVTRCYAGSVYFITRAAIPDVTADQTTPRSRSEGQIIDRTV
jgi:hypothetical protein